MLLVWRERTRAQVSSGGRAMGSLGDVLLQIVGWYFILSAFFVFLRLYSSALTGYAYNAINMLYLNSVVIVIAGSLLTGESGSSGEGFFVLILAAVVAVVGVSLVILGRRRSRRASLTGKLAPTSP